MTELQAIRVGVIGLGVGERHVAAYNAIPGCEVVAICDRDAARLTDVGERHAVPERTVDYRVITENPDIDVVSVCSHDDAHAEQCVSAFRNGKHVLVEKPAVLHRHEAEAVLRAQQDSGRYISSNLILRKSPRFLELKKMIDAGDFGEIVAIEGDYLHNILAKITDGWRARLPFYCVTYGGGVHLIDLMRWLVGEEVVTVCGMGNKILTRGTHYRFDDTIVNLLQFEGGTLGKTMTILGPRRPQLHALTVYGTKRTFVNEVPSGRTYRGESPDSVEDVSTPYSSLEKGALIPDFIAAIREGREPEIGAREVFRVMDICFAAWESVQAHRTVRVRYSI